LLTLTFKIKLKH